MSIVPVLLQHRAQLAQLFEMLETQRGRFWTDGKFSLPTLAEVQRLIASLPNLRDESLAALSRFGTPATIDPAAPLPLAGIGWIAARVDQLDEPQRIRATEQAIAMLGTRPDPELLAAALVLARSLGNDRREWEAKVSPLAQWATKHKTEIDEQATA